MLYERATRWLSGPRGARRVTLLAFCLTLPSLAIGLQADDYLLANQVARDPLAAYQFNAPDLAQRKRDFEAMRARGRVPWWSSELADQRFFRPLASLSLAFDFRVLRAPWLMHLENCALYAAIVWLACGFYRAVGLEGAGLGLASIFYALTSAFAQSVGWISSRNTLLAVAFGLAALLAHVRARSAAGPSSGRASLAVAWLCFTLGLLSAELAVGAFGFLLAYALLEDRAPLRARARSLSPYLASLTVYGIYYVAADHGARGLYFYRDLTSQPRLALVGLLESIPIYLASTLTAPFASFYALLSGGRIVVLLIALAILALLAPILLGQLRSSPAARWLGLGSVFAVAPLAGTVPQDRLTFFVALGTCGLLGSFVAAHYDSELRSRRIASRWLFWLHGLYHPATFVPILFAPAGMLLGGGSHALDRVVPHDEAATTIQIQGPTSLHSFHLGDLREYQGQAAPYVYTLYSGNDPILVTRSGERHLELQAPRGWLATPLERTRDLERAPFRAGDRIALDRLDVEVLEINEQHAPERVRFTFDRPLDDPSLTILCWPGRELSPCKPPALGETVRLTASAAL